ncbi:M48 family metallopeptidase [Altibacter sp. HG106]|uniref:M48 family metallopeptidase n=1 Tax=Altibacter sp. HG106 TaxID=3023937 RepID=UPI00234FE4BE|nr:M48 family metallopeptidase [Altibacter sp. HG106]MDC7993935.1 M48 family metallopeptidase [Altibacter sp. HG106]
MSPEVLFYILIGIIILNFIWDTALGLLNANHFDDPVPEELQGVFEEGEYQKSQRYKKASFRFGLLSSSFSLVVTLAFFFLEGFAWVDAIARSVTSHPVWVGLLFFGIIMFASDLLSTPFSYYRTFVIEEQFGFNKTTPKLFFIDKLKGWLLLGIVGGGVLAALILFYEWVGASFWWYAWGLITLISLLMNLFYARLIVPLFNKQTPLEEGSLRTQIEAYAQQVGFDLKNIFVIDGSKRSTKANAYFSGFGSQKRITLYDTLINDLEDSEIVAVLAHEVGHYKKRHIITNLIAATLSTGITLWLLSLLIGNPLLSEALSVAEPSFHIGLIAFTVLFTPISEITGLFMNMISRAFEYQADRYAETTFAAAPLINALKKLSKHSLSNLTPHPAYVFFYYSHPTLLQRVQHLKR